MDKIRILIVDDNAQTRKDLSRLLFFEDDLDVIGEAANGEEAYKKVGELHPDIVLMDINMPVMDGITATEKISRTYPDSAVIMISIQGEQEYLKKAMVAGARDYLVKPVNSEEAANTLRQVYNLEKARGKKSCTTAEVAEPEENNKIIAFFSGKGGCGKSIIASNLAVSLAMRGKKAVIVDLDLQFGDMSLLLNLSDIKSISDLVDEPEGINEQTLPRYLLRHSSGVHVISSCFSPQDAEKVNEKHFGDIINYLESIFDYIIIDTPCVFNDLTLSALERANIIIMPVICDLATIKNARTTMTVFKALDYTKKVRLVLNMEGVSYGVDKKDISESLDMEIFHSIPRDDKNILMSINKGIPVVTIKPPTESANSFVKLGEKIAPVGNDETDKNEQMKEKKSFFGKIIGTKKGGD